MPAAFPKTLAPADRIDGAAKSLSLLEAFGTERQRMNATMAAQRTGLSRAAARRHLLTLQALGYVECDDAGHFSLTPRVLRLAGSYLASARLPRLVQPMLNVLALQTGLTFSVAVADGQGLDDPGSSVVIVARSASPSPDRTTAMAYGLHLGSRPALHTTSTGRIFLAALRPAALNHWLKTHAQLGQLPRLTAHTLTSAESVKAAVISARDADFAYVAEQNELGVHAVAIALRNPQGQCAAALNAVASVQGTSQAALIGQVLPLMRVQAGGLMGVL